MLTHKESLLSAYHNYLVNDMLTPGFRVGDPAGRNDFYFVADIVLPGETAALISARLFDSQGRFLLELLRNRLPDNPAQCALRLENNGFRILTASGEPLLSVLTQTFTNGSLTLIRGRLYDAAGAVRMEPALEGIKVHEPADLILDAPFHARE